MMATVFDKRSGQRSGLRLYEWRAVGRQACRAGRRDPIDKGYRWRYFPDCTILHYGGAPLTGP